MPKPMLVRMRGSRLRRPDSETVRQEIQAELSRRLGNGSLQLPMLPHVAAKILSVSEDPAVGMEELRGYIETEPALVAKLLALANSADLGARHRVDSLTQALVLLGVRTVRDILFSVLVRQRVFTTRRYSPLMDACWRHSLGTAWAAGLLAEDLKIESESAFLAGLLHDIGHPALLHCLIEIEDTLFPGREVGQDAALGLIADGHEIVGSHVAQKWNLPPQLTEAITHHHHPGRCREYRVLTSLVFCGERIALRAGFGPGGEIDCAGDGIFRELGLAEETVLTITERTQQEVGALLEHFAA